MRKHDRVIRKHDDWTRNEIPCVSMIESYVSMTIGQNEVPCVSMIESYVSLTIGQEMKYHA
jgi:hypothetical protein